MIKEPEVPGERDKYISDPVTPTVIAKTIAFRDLP